MGSALGTAAPPSRSPLDPDAWRASLERAKQQLQYQLTSPRTVALYETTATHLADATTGAAVFWLGISTAQLVQRALRIGAATPVIPHLIGAIAVGSSSILALHFASLPRELLYDARFRSKDRHAVAKELYTKITSRIEDLQHAPFTVYMAMGVLSFTMLGGRMNSLAPSHFANLGAFHLKKASLPATELYADTVERGVIQQFGRLYGCHTCGAKQAAMYHADHMPPKFVAKQMNEALWRRLTRQEVAFRFYPQCAPCSNQQASVVRMGRADVRTHLSALRLYHTTGFWLVLLCTGGLYVGGSSFSETADVHQQQRSREPLSSKSRSKAELSLDASSSDHALLVSLRERERKLRRQRRLIHRNDELVAAIDAELETIKACKQRLKDTLRRQ